MNKIFAELAGYHPKYLILRLSLALLPTGWATSLRTLVYRASGIEIGTGTTIAGTITFGCSHVLPSRLKIGKRCFINSNVFIDTAAPVCIGHGVAIGHHVLIITSDHEIGLPDHRAGNICSKPVTIGNGAWIAAGVRLLPGVTIGTGAVVAAGAVVTRDVPPNTLAAGVPARIIRALTA